jgi:hypothetical protein
MELAGQLSNRRSDGSASEHGLCVFLEGVGREGLTIGDVTNAEPSAGGRSKIRRPPGVIFALKDAGENTLDW